MLETLDYKDLLEHLVRPVHRVPKGRLDQPVLQGNKVRLDRPVKLVLQALLVQLGLEETMVQSVRLVRMVNPDLLVVVVSLVKQDKSVLVDSRVSRVTPDSLAPQALLVARVRRVQRAALETLDNRELPVQLVIPDLVDQRVKLARWDS